MIIYQAENLINGKMYIGKTNGCLADRQWGHLNSAKKGANTVFYNAIRKYGEDNFKFSVIDDEVIFASELNDREKFYIKKFNSRVPNGYNMTDGGDGNDGTIKPNLGVPCSEEQKQKLRDANLGKKYSEETCQKKSNSLKKAYTEGRKEPWNEGLTKETNASVKAQSEKVKGIPAWNRGLKGYLKGRPAWNRGLTKETDPRLLKQAEAVSGKPVWNKGLTKEADPRVAQYSTNNSSQFTKGCTPWNVGIPMVHTEESNLKRSETMKAKGKKSAETVERMKAAQRERREKEKNVNR